MKWVDYGANAVSDYDLDPAIKPVVFNRFAYLSFVCIKDKALFHFEVDHSIMSKYFCLGIQLGGDSLLRIDVKVHSVGFDFCVWGYA